MMAEARESRSSSVDSRKKPMALLLVPRSAARESRSWSGSVSGGLVEAEVPPQRGFVLRLSWVPVRARLWLKGMAEPG